MRPARRLEQHGLYTGALVPQCQPTDNLGNETGPLLIDGYDKVQLAWIDSLHLSYVDLVRGNMSILFLLCQPRASLVLPVRLKCHFKS